MACFAVPAAEAIITTIVTKIVKNHEDKNGDMKVSRFSDKLNKLNTMLWGGSALLMFEHVWHGEIVPYYPFLTAASDAAGLAGMLHEMATTGTAMAILVTLVWAGMLLVSAIAEKKALADERGT